MNNQNMMSSHNVMNQQMMNQQMMNQQMMNQQMMNQQMMNNMQGTAFAESSAEEDSPIREKRETEDSAKDNEEVARQMDNTGHFFGNGPRFYNRWGWRTYDTMYRPFRQQNPFFFSMNQN